MKFKILKIVPFILLISLNGCSNNESTWTPRTKYVVAMQCGIFTKVRLYTKEYTNEEMKLLEYFQKYNKVNIQEYTEKDKKILRCCAKNIMDRYTQDEYMKKSNTKLELQIALDKCR